MPGKMPMRSGVVDTRGASREKLQPHVLRISEAAQLADLTEEYAFFTPALIYMRVRLLGRDPLAQFALESHHDVTPVSMKFAKPVFRGLNLGHDVSWNHVLFGMPQEYWEAFKGFMGTMAYLDRQLKRISRVRTKEFSIADPLFFEHATLLPPVIPTVPITVFCLDTNHGCAWIEPGNHALLDLPALRTTTKVFEDTAAFAQAILNDSSNPYDAVNAVQAQQAFDPVVPPAPVALESLPSPQQDALRDLVRQYHAQRGTL